MESNSMTNTCKKFLLKNINEPQEGVEHLWFATNELRNISNAYTILLSEFKSASYYYDDMWRSAIFSLADEKTIWRSQQKKNILKGDRDDRNILIREEKKDKRFLIKNVFDPWNGCLEFFHYLNKSMSFKLSQKHKTVKFCSQIMDKVRSYLTWQEYRDLTKIKLKTFTFMLSKKEKVQYFKNLSTKIKNSDFDEVSDVQEVAQQLSAIFQMV